MVINECIMHNSTCYKQSGTVPQHYGIVVHSTGCNQTRVARFVNPDDDDPNRDAIIAKLGKNRYNNDWNHMTVYKGVHFFIGHNADEKTVEAWQCLPLEQVAWGVASGSKGSFNSNPPYWQFEMCEDNLKNEDYFNKCMKQGQELCAYLCRIGNFGVDKIVSHKEAGEMGYGSKHGDPENWLSKFGKDMNWFRAEVKKLLDDDKKTLVCPCCGAKFVEV